MSQNGRWTAIAAAVGTTTATAGLSYLASRGQSLFPVQLGLAGFAAIVFPISWVLGRGYDKLKEEATVDCLTGAFNRRFIEATYMKLMNEAGRKRKKMTVMMLDVNDFKEVNDRFGHQQGDIALALIAETLREVSDRGEIIGRWGGDEFILICPYADDKGVERLSKRIQDQLLGVSMRVGLRLSVSIGTAIFPDQGKDLIQLMAIADKKMYSDKFTRKTIETEPTALQA